MKNKLLFLGLFFLIGMSLTAQTSVADMEENSPGVDDVVLQASWAGDPNAPTATKVANLDATGINTTANVIQFVETLNSHSDNSLQMAYTGSTATTGFNANTNRFLKFKMYSTIAKTFNLDVEVAANFKLEKSVTLAANTWTELLFDLTGNNTNITIGNANGWNSYFRIRVNAGTVGDGSTYYFDEFTIEAAKYTSVSDGDWATAANWSPANVPLQTTDDIDIISNITYTGDLSFKKLLVRNNRSLNVTGNLTVTDTSQLWGGASLIVSGTSTGSYAYFRTLSTPAVGDLEGWHLLSSPVSNETYDDTWISSFGIASGTSNTDYRGIAQYNNSVAANNWTYAEAPVASTAFGEGKGYSMKRTASGNVQFIGNIRTANITDIALTKNTSGYNLIGNPYSSYVSLNDLFTANNSGGNDLLESSTIWIWNATSKSYEAKLVQGTSFQIAPGQGFFVEASAGASTFTFNTSMLSKQSTDTFLKSSKTGIQLNIYEGTNTRYAKINYLENSTTSFDNGSDGKLFGGVSQPFAVYTQLVSNNEGKNYQIQSLPNSDLESMIVPVGVNAASGKEITFSAEALNLPSDIKVFLEDRLTNTFTRLDELNSNYKITLDETLNGIGRFYLHTRSSVLSTNDVSLENISIYKTNNSTLRIAGLQQGNSTIKLFNILGKQMMNKSFDSNGIKNIYLPKLSAGVYIVQLETESGKLNKKIILE